MTSLLEEAIQELVSTEIIVSAVAENIEPDELRELVAQGHVVILRNRHREVKIEPVAIGTGLRTKVNANIGTSGDSADIAEELKKLHSAIEAGTDTVMDLSTGGDLAEIRKAIIAESTVPVGTVPIYEAAVRRRDAGKPVVEMHPDELFEVIEQNGEQGVDFITVHCGVTRKVVDELISSDRIMDIVSRGGSFHAEWILKNERENPLYEQFDRLCEIAKKYEMVLSLGDGLRPGAIADATDRAQIGELVVLGELVDRARKNGVQAMVEGPGHVPIDDVPLNIHIQKEICNGAPFYVLGPIVTDIAPGYDHLTSAIGGAIAAMSGADYLCYVTRTEHLALPGPDAVREGVIYSRIAAHVGDIAKGLPGAWEMDLEMSKARHELDWAKMLELAIDPKMARQIRESSKPADDETCTMCGEFCAVKRVRDIKKAKEEGE
ncbi:MAG TPA: phosphomethylpyrimidine synthase ThiC [candidate division Zixibacteria bacterium]|nr:phosphomethylpyrimidine synthase ThiC [candidate division Zixibacteria bacterium]